MARPVSGGSISTGSTDWFMPALSEFLTEFADCSAVIFERQDFVAKLAVLVPAPRARLTRYHRVFAPTAKWRPLITPTGVESDVSRREEPTPLLGEPRLEPPILIKPSATNPGLLKTLFIFATDSG
jgi:hypothetical protein